TGYLGDALTNKVLAKQADDIKKVLGVIPRRAEQGLGMSSELNKSWGFAKVAQRIESIASGEVTLIAARKIMDSAMEAGAIPAVHEFVSVGLSKEQAQLAYRLLEENYGNGEKTIKEFLKATSTGQIEKWRYIKPNKKLADALQRFGLEDVFRATQRESTSAVEFQEKITKLLDDAKNNVDDLLRETHGGGLSKDVPPEMQEMMLHVNEAKKAGNITSDEADALENVIQAHRNVRAAAGELKNNLVAAISEAAGKVGHPTLSQDAADMANKIEQEFSAAMYVVDKIRSQTLKSVAAIRNGGDYGKIWHELKSGNLYDLEKMFPGVDPTQLDEAEIISHIWRGYFEGSGAIYNNSNVSFTKSIVQNLTNLAIDNGVNVNFIQKVQKNIKHIYSMAENAQSWEKEYQLQKVMTGKSAQKGVAGLFNAFGFPTASAEGKPINTWKSVFGGKYENLDEVPFEEAKKGLTDWREGRLGKKAKTAVETADEVTGEIAKAAKPIPPYIEGTVPNKARVFYESFEAFSEDASRFVKDVVDKWDEVEDVPPNIAENVMNGLKDILGKSTEKMSEARIIAAKYSEGIRDFILHDYNKTYMDAAIAYWSPFHYWQTRTYMRGIEAITYAPKWAHFYNVHKEYLANIHAGLPDYWKNSIKIDNILGIELDNPLYFNLEASLNPYYNMLGTDFNDPNKRVDFLSRTVMDISSTRYSPIPMVNWAIALNLFRKNETEAAQRYLGRLIPQSQAIKALQAKTNIYLPETPFSRHGEIDPFVNFAMGGLDPYERRRVGRKGAEMIQENPLMAEEVFDASIIQSGKTWYDMVERALDERANGQMFSEFVGVGFKPRTPGDMMVDEFYSEMFRLIGTRDNMSSEQYRLEWNKLRERYPFADIVLLSGKSGAERESAIAYGTLSRIQPGLQTELLKVVGLNSEDIDRFYADKGDMTNWSPQDRDAFNSNVARLAFVTRIPNRATKDEWEQTRFMYAEMKDRIATQRGDNIGELVYGVPQDGTDRQRFYEQYPQVLEAYELQKQYMIANPMLNAYYGGIETISRYYDEALKDTMREKYGDDIYDRYYSYLNQPTNELKREVLSKDSELKKFMDDGARSALQDMVNRKIGEIASLLPDIKQTQFRNLETGVGQAVQETSKPVTAQAITEAIMAESGGKELMEMVKLYATGEEMPFPAQQRLEYIGSQFGLFSWSQVIQILLSSQ
ncbi:MAG: hypothetical protein WC657_07195, partial [Candidatus Paceibacterota bacterium]